MTICCECQSQEEMDRIAEMFEQGVFYSSNGWILYPFLTWNQDTNLENWGRAYGEKLSPQEFINAVKLAIL